MNPRALLSSPDPRAVSRTAAVAVALVGATLAHPVLLLVDEAVREAERVDGGWAAVALSTVFISLLHFAVTSRASNAGAVFVRCAVLGIALGPINSGLALAGVTALRDGLGPTIAQAFVLGAVFGAVQGATIGLLFGVLYSPLAMAASLHRARPSHAGPDKVRALAGAAITAASIVHHVCLPDPIGVQLIVGAIGLGLLGSATFRLVRLARFLRSVRRGAEPTWSLSAPRDPWDGVGLLPVHANGAAEEILYRAVGAEPATPYRAQTQWLPIARLAP